LACTEEDTSSNGTPEGYHLGMAWFQATHRGSDIVSVDAIRLDIDTDIDAIGGL
jgi:hypothetical protein